MKQENNKVDENMANENKNGAGNEAPEKETKKKDKKSLKARCDEFCGNHPTVAKAGKIALRAVGIAAKAAAEAAIFIGVCNATGGFHIEMCSDENKQTTDPIDVDFKELPYEEPVSEVTADSQVAEEVPVE